MKLIHKYPVIASEINNIYWLWAISDWIIPVKDESDMRWYLRINWNWLTPKTTPAFYDCSEFVDWLGVVTHFENNEKAVVDTAGKMVFQFEEYDYITILDKDHFIVWTKNKKAKRLAFWIVNRTGKEIIPIDMNNSIDELSNLFYKKVEIGEIKSDYVKEKLDYLLSLSKGILYTKEKDYYVNLFEWNLYDSNSNLVITLPDIILSDMVTFIDENNILKHPEKFLLYKFSLKHYNWVFSFNIPDINEKNYPNDKFKPIFFSKDWELLWLHENTLWNSVKDNWDDWLIRFNWMVWDSIVHQSEITGKLYIYKIDDNFINIEDLGNWIFDLNGKKYYNKVIKNPNIQSSFKYFEDFMANSVPVEEINWNIEINWKKFNKKLLKIR